MQVAANFQKWLIAKRMSMVSSEQAPNANPQTTHATRPANNWPFFFLPHKTEGELPVLPSLGKEGQSNGLLKEIIK
jgi:hypothetical protein